MPSIHRPTITGQYPQSPQRPLPTASGQSALIRFPEFPKVAQRLRAQHHAVMVGAGTILADDPRLTVRLVEGRSPVRVVADSRLRIPLDATVLTDGAARTIIATTAEAPAEKIDAIRGLGAE